MKVEASSAATSAPFSSRWPRSRSRRTERWRRSGRCSRWRSRRDDWALTVNPAVGIGMHHEEQRERYPQNGELERLVAALQRRGDRAGQFFLTLLFTGARRGELLAMRWSDVDLDGDADLDEAGDGHEAAESAPPAAEPAGGRSAQDQARSSRSRRSARSACRRSGRRGPRCCAMPRSPICASTTCGIGMPRCSRAWALSLPIIGALLGHASRRRRSATRTCRRRFARGDRAASARP